MTQVPLPLCLPLEMPPKLPWADSLTQKPAYPADMKGHWAAERSVTGDDTIANPKAMGIERDIELVRPFCAELTALSCPTGYQGAPLRIEQPQPLARSGLGSGHDMVVHCPLPSSSDPGHAVRPGRGGQAALRGFRPAAVPAGGPVRPVVGRALTGWSCRSTGAAPKGGTRPRIVPAVSHTELRGAIPARPGRDMAYRPSGS